MNIIIVLSSIIFFILLLSSISNTPQKRGKVFENQTAKAIKDLFETNVFQNVLLPNNDFVMGVPGSVEIDMVFVTMKGIFCIECKSHIGDAKTQISGSLTHDIWQITGKTFDMLPNPFMQNERHIKSLNRILEKEYHITPYIYNMVVLNNLFLFSYYGTVSSDKDCYILPNDNKIILTDARGKGFKQLQLELDKYPDVYSSDQVQQLSDIIKSYIGSRKELKEHVLYVQAKHEISLNE